MKIKWQLTLGIITLFTLVLSASVLWYFTAGGGRYLPGDTQDNKSTMPPPAPRPEPVGVVDSLLAHMAFGNIAFNVPDTINIDDATQIQLLLSLDESIETLKQSISAAGEKAGASISVSNVMEARLTGQQFQVSAITPAVQAVSKRQQTQWQWQIQAKKAGRHRLHLTLSALLQIDGQSTPRTIKTFAKAIEVNVTAGQQIEGFFKNNWQWLWTALLLPLAAWLVKMASRRTSP